MVAKPATKPLGRFAAYFQLGDHVEITNYSQCRQETDHDFIGLKCVVGTVYEHKGNGCVASSENEIGDDGWVKFWPLEDDDRVPDNKLWLYQPRGRLISRND